MIDSWSDQESMPVTGGGAHVLSECQTSGAGVEHGRLSFMRIAQVCPLYESCPPRLYGGTERIVYYLTEELLRLGHEVTLFASGDSQTSALLEAPCEQALRLNKACKDPLVYTGDGGAPPSSTSFTSIPTICTFRYSRSAGTKRRRRCTAGSTCLTFLS